MCSCNNRKQAPLVEQQCRCEPTVLGTETVSASDCQAGHAWQWSLSVELSISAPASWHHITDSLIL